MSTRILRLLILLVLSLALSNEAFGQRCSRGSGPYRGEGYHTKCHGGSYAGSKNSHPRGAVAETRRLTTSTPTTSLTKACPTGFTEAADMIIGRFW